jgi:hypothetical protein
MTDTHHETDTYEVDGFTGIGYIVLYVGANRFGSHCADYNE